jgi:hypothetical protein
MKNVAITLGGLVLVEVAIAACFWWQLKGEAWLAAPPVMAPVAVLVLCTMAAEGVTDLFFPPRFTNPQPQEEMMHALPNASNPDGLLDELPNTNDSIYANLPAVFAVVDNKHEFVWFLLQGESPERVCQMADQATGKLRAEYVPTGELGADDDGWHVYDATNLPPQMQSCEARENIDLILAQPLVGSYRRIAVAVAA